MATRKMHASTSKEIYRAELIEVKVRIKVRGRIHFRVRIIHMGRLRITEDPTGIVRVDLRYKEGEI